MDHVDIPPAYPADVKAIQSATTQGSRFTKILRRGAFSLGLAVLAGAGLWQYRSARHSPILHFETATVDRGPVSAKVTATGALSALVTVSVGSQVSGRIEKIFVDFGSVVRQGQTVATIDPSFLKAAVAQARANYLSAKAAVDKATAQGLQAKRSYARARELSEAGLASRADLETAEADLGVADAAAIAAGAGVAQAKAALEQAELNLRYATIVSPIDGIVISRNVDVGQTVAAALQAPTLFLIAQDLTRMQVDTNVAEADVGKIQAAMPVTFMVDAHPGKSFRGIVRQVRDNAQTIQNVVTYDAVIDVDNTERLLKPGMTANVTFVYATRDGVLRIPNAAIRFKPEPATLAAMQAPARSKGATEPSAPPAQPEDRSIWVRRGEGATPVTVRVGISDGASTEVISGDLQDHEEVIIEASTDGTPGKAK